MKYPIAPDGIFWSLQGEGHLRGFQMAFLRLAGCSVSCNHCDTDYSVDRRVSAADLAAQVDAVIPSGASDRWVWITGGEPADHDLRPLIDELRKRRCSIAVATSGHKRVIPPVDWLSVSPHGSGIVQMYGNEIKLIPGLGGLELEPFLAKYGAQLNFMYRYVQPLMLHGSAGGSVEYNLAECIQFLRQHPDWSLSRQDHKHWGMP